MVGYLTDTDVQESIRLLKEIGKMLSALSLKVIGELNLMETVCANLPFVGMGLITKLKTCGRRPL